MQTYANRELLILADGQDVLDLVPPNDDTIALVHLSQSVSIGEKRNLACQYAQGDAICHWDDDDYSAPQRLQDQVRRLVESAKAVTGYRTMRCTDGSQWWEYRGASNYSLGTSLLYWRSWWEGNQFRSLQVGEDNSFVAHAAKAGQLVTAEAGDLMFFRAHPGNTSPKQIRGAQWKKLDSKRGVASAAG